MSYFLKIVLIAALATLEAKELGTFGHLFPIAEEDLREVIQHRLAHKKLELECSKNCQSPQPVLGISSAIEYRSFLHDPSFYISRDIFDHNGELMFKKGSSINPLDHIPLGEELLFLDGYDADQINWAKSQNPSAKWILIKGRPMALEEQEERPIYFDQFGQLTDKLGIIQVPARVSQEGNKLKVEEIPLKEGK